MRHANFAGRAKRDVPGETGEHPVLSDIEALDEDEAHDADRGADEGRMKQRLAEKLQGDGRPYRESASH